MRWIPWIDVVTFLGIPLLMTIGMVAAVFTPQEWNAVMVGFAIGVPVFAWAIGALLIVQRWRTRPTFQLAGGSRIWTNGIPEIKPELVERALEHYMATMLDHSPLEVTRPKLLGMVGALRAEFTWTAVTWWGSKHNYAGLQSGHAVKVHWRGGFKANAFWHELIHMQRQLIHGLEPDYRHEDGAWWRIVGVLKGTWKE